MAVKRCATKQCWNRPRFAPVIKLADFAGPIASVMIHVPLCGLCQKKTTMERFVNDEQWEALQIYARKKGSRMPIRGASSLEFVSLH